MLRNVTFPRPGAGLRLAARAGVLSLVVAGTVAFVQMDHTQNPQITARQTELGRGGVSASRSLDRQPVAEGTAVTVTVQLDSGAKDITTTAGTVRGLLAELDVVVDPETYVSEDLDQTLSPGMVVVARTPRTTVKTMTETVDFKSSEVPDPNLEKGSRITEVKGQQGRTTVTYLVMAVDGVEVRRTPVTTHEVTQTRDEVVRVGTMDLPDASVKVLSPTEAKALAKTMLAERGMDGEQYTCLENLWTRESGWRVTAANTSSGAYGIPQALPGTKMAAIAPDWKTNARTQITWGLGYIKDRYSTPCGAWSFFQTKGWY